MIERLATRISPSDAEYLHHLLSAAFAGVALVAVLLLMIRRGPIRGLEAAAP